MHAEHYIASRWAVVPSGFDGMADLVIDESEVQIMRKLYFSITVWSYLTGTLDTFQAQSWIISLFLIFGCLVSFPLLWPEIWSHTATWGMSQFLKYILRREKWGERSFAGRAASNDAQVSPLTEIVKYSDSGLQHMCENSLKWRGIRESDNLRC